MATAQPSNNPNLFSDGTVTFVVKRATGETTHSMDLLVAKLCCEQCQDVHQLRIADGRIHPTPEFLIDLADRFSQFGVENCTPSIAWQIWLAVIDQMNNLKKNTSEMPSSHSGTESTPEPSPPASGSDSLQTSGE